MLRVHVHVLFFSGAGWRGGGRRSPLQSPSNENHGNDESDEHDETGWKSAEHREGDET